MIFLKLQLLQNERGDMTLASVILILALNLLTAFLLLFTTVQIQCIHIQDTVKMELNNISAVIAEDTHAAMREGNLEEYAAICSSDSYRSSLTQLFKDNLAKSLQKDTKAYTISNENISVQELDGRMEFEYQCRVNFRVTMFGNTYSVFNREISLTGSHVPKF